MRITLQIENVDRLETGGQVSYTCSDRGFDIGRHEHLDWSLPDPQRVVSGKHCEVRFEGGQFVLYDVSTNGTFLNGNPNRMDKAHPLRSGDRLMIGDYIVVVSLDAEGSASAGFGGAPASGAEQGFQPQPAQWQAPQQPAPAAAEPQWPSAQPPVQAPYPDPGGGGPWSGAPSAGMEGRHAPPSHAPGVGTPADDVWSQQGHGWGSADPALYDPQSQRPEAAPARPAQADPLDHLAAQPSVQPQSPAVEQQPALQGEPSQAAPFPGAAPGAAQQGAAEPIFKMPDIAAGEEPVAPPPAVDAPPAEPAPQPPQQEPADVFPAEPEGSPFPDTPAEDASDHSSRGAEAEQHVQEVATPLEEPAPQERAPVAEIAQPVKEARQSAEQVGADVVEIAGADFLKAFSEGAGIPETLLAGRDPEEFAREIGSVLQDITSDLMGLLQARSKVKAMTRNANRTLISRSGNNALKFSPTPQMALQTMLAHNVEDTGYLPLPKAMSAAFKDIQKHHVWTYAAMQKAAARFDETLSPRAIEEEGKVAKSTFSNQKVKLWEHLNERWSSLAGAYDDGLVGVFTQYFTESYEEFSNEEPEQ